MRTWWPSELAALAAVEDCWFVAGEESFVVKVRVPDVGGLEQAIRACTKIRGVARTRSTVVLSTRFEGRVQAAGSAQPELPSRLTPRLATGLGCCGDPDSRGVPDLAGRAAGRRSADRAGGGA